MHNGKLTKTYKNVYLRKEVYHLH